ncbi:redoxin domain-containing protein [Myxococcota bacterium]|nr:redoxin domain-containing protein [Myxococcota bacterium]
MSVLNLVKQTLRMKPLPVGAEAPPLSLTADEGTWIRLPDFKDHLNVVLLFFRKTNDDATDATLKAFDARLEAFEKLDTVVFAISTFKTDRLRQFRSELGLEFFLLYDPLAVESRRFGCSGRVRPYARPGVVVIGKDGKVSLSQHGLPTVEQILSHVAGVEGREVPQEEQEENRFTGVRDPGGQAWRVKELEADEALAKLKDDSFKLVDVRTKEEYDADHVPDSVLLPVDELPHRYQELGQTTHLIFICQNGGRSAQAAEFIASIGGSEIYNVSSGISAWTGERRSATGA